MRPIAFACFDSGARLRPVPKMASMTTSPGPTGSSSLMGPTLTALASAGGDEAVSAVVADAAQHEEAALRRGHLQGALRQGLAGVLHEDGGRHAVGVGGLVDLAHLQRVEGPLQGLLMMVTISRTAGSKPTSTARETIAWPMFSSSISAMRAMGRTLS
jgi:hypothetical protein